jgi:hypothetical protein
MSLRSWPRPPSTTTINSAKCLRFSTCATINRGCFTSCWSRGAVSPLERPPGSITQLWLWMFRRWWRSPWSLTTIQTWCARCDLFESSRWEVLCDATNEILCMSEYPASNRCDEHDGRINVCYALLRMRPLSISWAECSVVISCGKVDYDKSG